MAAGQPRIALAHDWLVGLRGGEHVLDRLARMYGPTELYTLVSNGRALSPAIDACDVHPSWLQRIPGSAGRLRRHLLPLMPAAVSSISVAPCDLLISTSSAVMKSIRPPAGVPHLCYCHSPARYVWEQTEDYGVGSGGRLRRAGLRMIGPRFRDWDRRTASRVTRFIANSRHTAARIERAFDRASDVIYPPARTEYFTPDEDVEREDWLLVVAALEPYKRTDLVIDAARQAGFRLRIAGSGSQAEALAARGGGAVEVLGRVSDEALRDLYRRARALVFPQVEDFGIVPVEALACGCPVIAYRAGGAAESVTEACGVFFEEQTAAAIAAAVESFRSGSIAAGACRTRAEEFSEARFDAEVAGLVDELLGATATASTPAP